MGRGRHATSTRSTVSVPRRYADVGERYRTLERHSVNIDAHELQLAHSLAEKWRELYVFARTKDLRLAKVKEDFRAVTTEQSEAFQEELKELRTQFYSDGPIAGKVSLEEGVLLMVDYAQTLQKCVAKKDELVNAEDLFGAARGVLDFESLEGVGAVVAAMASRRWRRAPRRRCGPVARERSSARRDAVDAAARESTRLARAVSRHWCLTQAWR